MEDIQQYNGCCHSCFGVFIQDLKTCKEEFEEESDAELRTACIGVAKEKFAKCTEGCKNFFGEMK